MVLNSKYDYLKKKLLYKSTHRGCKETDLLFSKFVNQYLDYMNEAELLDYEIILNQTDADVVSWVMGHTDVPKNLQSSIMIKLLNIHKT